MRRTLIASSLAALASAASPAELCSPPSLTDRPATPTTLAPGLDIFADMGLTPEQGDCLVANVGTVDINDITALMDLMTQCGISADQLAQIGSQSATTEPGIAEPATTEPVDIDAATASAVLALLGLDQTAVDCLVSGSIGAPLDDAAAEQVFVGCGVGPAQVLEAIVALNTLAAAAEVDTVTDVLDSAPPVTSGNAMVDMLHQQLAAQGNHPRRGAGSMPPRQHLRASIRTTCRRSLAVFTETCGIDIAELIPDD